MIMRLRDVVHTTTFRLTAALGVIFVVAVAALLALTFALAQRELIYRTDRVLQREVARLDVGAPRHMADRVRDVIEHTASGLNFYVLLAPDGRQVIGSLSWRGAALPLDHAFDVPAGRLTAVPLRVLIVPLGDGARLVVARDVTPVADLRASILATFLWSGGAVILLAAIAAVALSLRPLRRIHQIRTSAQRIAAGDLAQRMPVSRWHDELDVVSVTINAMVADVERLMEQVKGTTDAIAHDLRTPLGHLRMRLREVQQGQDRDDPLLTQAIGELDAVLARFAALLRISELDATVRRAGLVWFDPAPMLEAVIELYAPLAEERDMTLSLQAAPGCRIEGDAALLFEAVGNLLDNAIKFSPPGGCVELGVARQGDRVAITVRDHGPGIAMAEREDVLRRFQRGAAARHAPGSGLGLSLVAAIAHLHGFTLHLDDATPGLIAGLLAPGEP